MNDIEGSEAERWLREAGEELATARHLAHGPGLPERQACFFAHLAAEKALKGLILAIGERFRFVHNLLELRNQLPGSLQDDFDAEDLKQLNPWAILGRYLVEGADDPEIDVEGMLAIADDVVTTARHLARQGE